MINASSAYARGATGAGTLIGIMDSGVDIYHQELDSNNKFTNDSYLTYQSRSPTTEEKQHGTHVSGIAVGDKDGSGMHGVAFDAQLFFISIELSDPPETYEPQVINPTVDYTGVDNSWSQLEDYFVQRNVTVVNGSFGYQGNINEYTEENLRYAFPLTIAVMAQANKADEDKTIFVWSAGNGGAYADQGVDYSSPEVFAGMAYLLTELQGNSVAVVSVDSVGEISYFSNRCGVSKDYCIAAPGSSIYSAYAQDSPVNNLYASWSGTSMAAPHVSGGIALLADYFRNQLGNTEILERLFLTANKTGIYEDSSIYGQGLMDLDAATSPVGQTTVLAMSQLGMKSFPAFSTSLSSFGPAIGDAWVNQLNREFAVFDQLGAPFFQQLNSTYFSPRNSVEWLSYKYTNPTFRTKEIEKNISPYTSLTFGLNVVGRGEHKFSPTLWARDEQKLRYFSLRQDLSDKAYYFVGSGLSPSLYFGNNIKKVEQRKIFGKLDLSSPYMSFGEDGTFVGGALSFSQNLTLSASFFSGNHADMAIFKRKKDNQGLVLEFQSSLENSIFSVQTGLLTESSSLLGSSFEGGFGSLQESLTYFSGINALVSWKKINASGSLFVGQTKPKLNEKGIISGFEDLSSSSFNFTLFAKELFNKEDSIGLRISQPLRLENGGVYFSIPVGRKPNKEIIFENYSSDLNPSGRQVNLEFIYRMSSKYGSFYSRLGVTKDEGHFKRQGFESFFETIFEVPLN